MTNPGITAERQDTAPLSHPRVSERTTAPTDRQPTMTTPPPPAGQDHQS